jgi:hypothetical protein
LAIQAVGLAARLKRLNLVAEFLSCSCRNARGFKFPVPSEFDYDMLDNIIRHRFKEGAGSRDVVLGNYEFCKTNMRSATITATSRLAPGTAITMAVIISSDKVSATSCPMPKCNSLQAEYCPGGGFIWWVIQYRIVGFTLTVLKVLFATSGLTRLLRVEIKLILCALILMLTLKRLKASCTKKMQAAPKQGKEEDINTRRRNSCLGTSGPHMS